MQNIAQNSTVIQSYTYTYRYYTRDTTPCLWSVLSLEDKTSKYMYNVIGNCARQSSVS